MDQPATSSPIAQSSQNLQNLPNLPTRKCISIADIDKMMWHFAKKYKTVEWSLVPTGPLLSQARLLVAGPFAQVSIWQVLDKFTFKNREGELSFHAFWNTILKCSVPFHSIIFKIFGHLLNQNGIPCKVKDTSIEVTASQIFIIIDIIRFAPYAMQSSIMDNIHSKPSIHTNLSLNLSPYGRLRSIT